MDSPRRFPAHCDACGHAYQVPDPAKSYACRACEDGRVHADPVVCPACEEEVGPDDAYCESCGAALTAEEEAPAARPAGRRSPRSGGASRTRSGGASRTHRRRASGDLARAMKLVRTLRVFYVINAVLHGLAVLGLVLAFSADPQEAGLLTALLVVQALLTATMVAGIFLVVHQPLVWAVVMACLVTVSRLINAWDSDWHVLTTLLGGLWALAFWALVGPAARASRLMEEHPDLPTVARLDAGRPRAARRAAVGAGAALVLAFGPAWMVHRENATPPFEPVWERFSADWERGGFAVANWIEAADGAEAARSFRDHLRALDWDTLPALAGATTEQSLDARGLADDTLSARPRHVRKRLDLGDGAGSVRFAWDFGEAGWQLTELTLPNPPFPEVLVEQLAVAWRNSNVSLLVATAERPERFAERVERRMEREGWEKLPDVLDAAAMSDRSQTVVEFETTEGSVRFDYACSQGVWRLRSIRWP